MDILAYILQFIGGVAFMFLGSIIVGISAVLEEDSWWKGFLCVLVGIVFWVFSLRWLLSSLCCLAGKLARPLS